MAETDPRLAELTQQLTAASGTVDATLKHVVDCAVKVVGVPRVSIRLLDPEHRALIAICRAGQPLHKNATVTYDLDEGLIGWVAKQGKLLRLGDAMADSRFVKRPDMLEPMGSFLGVPIISGRQILGVLSSVATLKDVFTAEHEQLLS